MQYRSKGFTYRFDSKKTNNPLKWHYYESGYLTKAAAAGYRAGITRSDDCMLRKEELEYSKLRVIEEYLFTYFICLFTKFVNW